MILISSDLFTFESFFDYKSYIIVNYYVENEISYCCDSKDKKKNIKIDSVN